MGHIRTGRVGLFVALCWLCTGNADGFAGQDASKTIRNTPARTVVPAEPAEIPLVMDGGQAVIRGSINGRGPFSFLIDTGISNVVLDDGVVERAGLKIERPVRFADRSLIAADAANLVQIESLALGEARFEGLSAMVVDLDLQLDRARGLDGIIGLPVFADCVMTIDYAYDRVRVSRGGLPATNGKDILDFETKDGWPMVAMTLGDFATAVAIDTTIADAIIIGERIQFDVSLSAPRVRERLDHVISDVNMSRAQLKGVIRMGRHQLVDTPVTLAPGPTRLGHEALVHFAVSFDLKNHRVRFDRKYEDAISLSPRSRFGLVLKRVKTVMEIVYIVPGSPADIGYLAVGEEIVSIDGRAVQRYRDEQLRELLRTADSIGMKVGKEYAELHVVLKAR